MPTAAYIVLGVAAAMMVVGSIFLYLSTSRAEREEQSRVRSRPIRRLHAESGVSDKKEAEDPGLGVFAHAAPPGRDGSAPASAIPSPGAGGELSTQGRA